MAIMGTLAKLEEYFKGWHTKYYELLHKGLPPENHANVKASKYVLGHVKLTDTMADQCEDGLALCPKALYNSHQNLSGSISDNTRRIQALEDYMLKSQPAQLKIGKLWAIDDSRLESLIINDDDNLNNYVSEPGEYFEGRLGAWGASKVEFDAGMRIENRQKLMVKVIGSNGQPRVRDSVWININDVWYPRTTNRLGYVFINMDLHQVGKSFYDPDTGAYLTGERFKNAFRTAARTAGDIWKVINVVDDIDDVPNWNGTNNTINKNFVINYGRNLWHDALADTHHIGQVFRTTNTYYVNPTRSSNPNLKDCGVYIEGESDPIGYKIYDVTNGQYFRYPRTSYPYGHRLSTDRANYSELKP